MRRLLSGVALTLALIVAGCGSTPTTPAPVSPPAAMQPAAVTTPTAVHVRDLGADSTLIPLGLDPTGALEAPSLDAPMQAGWYADGVKPGAPGPAVVAAHVNAHGRPGLFAQLHTLKPGALVDVDRADGSTITFKVTRVETHPKDKFPTAAVYGDTPGPELRLITCGGALDERAHRYLDNVIAWAVPA